MNITMREWIIIVILMSAGIAYIAMAEESDVSITHKQFTNYESSANQTALLELYTSEGCSSCPPADRWLSSLQNDPGLWKEFIPIALHVDYWDYIGWKDRFARPAHSARQRQYAREQSLKTVYTPGFIYNGDEWRRWFVKNASDFPESTRTGVLKLEVHNQLAKIQFTPEQQVKSKIKVNIALLGFDLHTSVKAGENKGKKLPHDFVVLAMNQSELQMHAKHYRGQLDIPQSTITTDRYAIVAWVNDSLEQKPLQAVGGWFH